jgi:hypothetical protein
MPDNSARRPTPGGYEGSFIIAAYLSVLRSGALSHRLPYAFSVLDEL